MDNYGHDPNNIYQYYEDPHAQQQNMYQHQQGQVRAYNAPPVPGEADAEPEESYPDGDEFLSNDYVNDVDTSQYDNLPSAVSYIPPEPVQHPKTVLEELPGIFEEEPDIDEPVPATTEKRKPNQKKKKKKKKSRRRHDENQKAEDKAVEERQDSEKENAVEAEIEYVEEKIAMDEKDPFYKQFARVFQAFKIADLSVKTEEELELEKKKRQEEAIKTRKVPKFGGEDEEDMSEKKKEDDDKPKLSKRKLKLLTRLSVAELKQVVARPDVVEMHDVTARDPTLLVILKSTRNTVPVPRHWCAKRKYLQGKRGFEKPPFELPHFIKKTGIQEMRGAVQEKEDAKSLKAKMRERIRPKMGKIDIDYQKLHDAFFKWQTKPKMTIHGDLYYEGKEFETRLKEKKPGELSEELRTALGMPTGPNAHKIPPPWLIAMQRYGPPPSYPNLKIPGLNAPIPDSCSFGYHAGGWGKPPVDETGRPLYGDVFGYYSNDQYANLPEEEVDRTLWGELESEEEEEEEEESEEESAAAPEDTSGMATPAEGLITPAASGTTSVPAGMETPDMIELRKKKIEAEMEMGEMPSLYTVIPEKRVEKVGAAMMGSTHVYDISVTNTKNAGVDVALDPSELELDSEALAARYEQTLKDQGHISKEDVSDLIAPHVSKNKGKRKKPVPHDSNKPAKKYKEFKF